MEPFSQFGHELPGLRVEVDSLDYHHDAHLPPDRPHAFIYFLTIRNESEESVTLRGRKWLVRLSHGEQFVVEGEGIVGQQPQLLPGERFSYHSFHLVAASATARGAFHGVTASGQHVFVRIPAMRLAVPGQGDPAD